MRAVQSMKKKCKKKKSCILTFIIPITQSDVATTDDFNFKRETLAIGCLEETNVNDHRAKCEVSMYL